ncbi:MAG TPA: N-acetyl-gamma-glutamyl-phosphate reductase [Clostridiales bacterium]|nr:N-acetyl-gamma-glutamyl-phosphate reductase [Clostridiales bacterium]
MRYRVYIDGQEGTTGLQLQKRLSRHKDIELMLISDELRKDINARREFLNSADLVFLCLPDPAAKEAVSLIDNDKVKVIDASTAHRTAPNWVYGFPELSLEHRKAVASSNRIANPGCHATGFIAIVFPLVKLGILPKDYPLTCHSITGYSGGGKGMIASYEAGDRPYQFDSPRPYALSLTHKHLPEMMAVTGIERAPVFSPIVCDFYSGMAVSVPLHTSMFTKKLNPPALQDMLAEYYGGEKLISVHGAPEDGFLAANELRDTCLMRIHVCGNSEQLMLISVFDNLGKGASGAAVQNMNIALGLYEFETLI